MSIHITNPKSTFIHVPKTGGESVSDWMRIVHGKSFKRNEKHSTYHEMKRKYKDLGFTWGVVRNPWERMVSGYHYYVRKNARILRQKNHPINSFEEFLKKGEFGRTISIPQAQFLPPSTSLIIRFENLNEEFKQIQEFYNTTHQLPHKNKSNHVHYSTYYTDQWMIDKVEKKFHQDVKRFNYEFTYK